MASFAPSFYYGAMAADRVADDSAELTALEQQEEPLTAIKQPGQRPAVYSTYLAQGMAGLTSSKMAPSAYVSAAPPLVEKEKEDQLPADYFLRRPDLEKKEEIAKEEEKHLAKEYKDSVYAGWEKASSKEKAATFVPLKVQQVGGSRLVQPVKTAPPPGQQQASHNQPDEFATVEGDAFKPVLLSEYHLGQLNDLASYVDSKH